jgi:hypothetical protein
MTEEILKKRGYVRRVTTGRYVLVAPPEFVNRLGRRQSLGESLVERALNALDIPDYETEKRFTDLVNVNTGAQLRIDFYIHDYAGCAYAIEFDGAQHHAPVAHFGGDAAFVLRQRLDKVKDRYCRRNGIKMVRLRVPVYWQIMQSLYTEIVCAHSDDIGLDVLFADT